MEQVDFNILRALLEYLAKPFDIQFEEYGFLEEFFNGESDIEGKFIQDDVAKLFVLGFEFFVAFFGFFLEVFELFVVELIDSDAEPEVVVGDGYQLLVGHDCLVDHGLELRGED